MLKLFFALIALLLSTSASAADCQQFAKPPIELEPDQWLAAFSCHKTSADAGDPNSQLWVGRAYLLGYGDNLSATTAAAWFAKAADQGNESAAFELADLIYYKQIPRGSYKSPYELYRQGIDVSQQRLMTEFNEQTPRSRVVELLMKGDGVKRDWQLALSYSTDIRQIDYVRIITRKKVNLKIDSEKVKDQMKVSDGMSSDQAADALLCNQPSGKNTVSLFSVFATVEALGVPIEKAMMRPCSIDSKKRTPFIYALANLHLDESTNYDWPRQLAMYLVFTRGDFKAFDEALRTPLKSKRTISGEINFLVDEAAQVIKDRERKFRKIYSESKPEMRSNIKFGYEGYEWIRTWGARLPLHLINPQTSNFSRCVNHDDNYEDIDDLPRLREHYRNNVGGLAGGMMAGLITACLDEPDYKTKMLKMRPYVLQVREWSAAKPDREPIKDLIGLGRALHSICRFEGMFGEVPVHCHRSVNYEVHRLLYWADNSRAGYGITNLPPAP